MLMEGHPPFVFIFLCQVKIRVRIGFGKPEDLFIGLFNVFIVEPCFTGHGIDHRESGISYITGLVIKDDGFICIREGIFESLFPKIEFLVGGVSIEACKMGAKIASKSRRGQIFSYRSPTQMVQALKNPDLQARFGKVGSNDSSVMTSSDN